MTLVEQSSSSQLPVKIVEYLNINPFINVKNTVEKFGVVFATAQRAILLLEDKKILTQIGKALSKLIFDLLTLHQ